RRDYEDLDAVTAFAAAVQVVTFEFENVPEAAARALAARVPVHPPPAALARAQDRVSEKTLFAEHQLAVPPWRAVDDRAGLARAIAELGAPAVLKTRRMGYDGKGQAVLRTSAGDALDAAWRVVGGAPSILEAFVPFEREVSLIGVRAQDGACVFYPLIENVHRNGILHRSLAPAPDADALQRSAEAAMRRILDALAYVGVLTIEFFVHQGRLLGNEMAPRVHNSGHWTIEGAVTSQFENHLRAVVGLPLGSTAVNGVAAMVNLIGTVPPPAEVLAIPGAHLHLYGKSSRPGRKVGHVTVVAADAERLAEPLARVEALVG
ncbi:MAG: 5-(carboxyamino)imidazole ribonucleotide synthase, partial [Planctomycetes bacterium]|nr:5-(carboxyamino)imidazole ribonucleotide synthase [Planctomycetota bacterium]